MKLATYEAVVENGQIKLTDPVRLPEHARVYVVVTGMEEPAVHVASPRLAHPGQTAILAKEVDESGEAALLAEPALAEDWSRPDEEAAWSHLQSAE
jgi:hypothetical protein